MAGRPREDWRAGSSRTATGGIVCAESRLGGSFSSASPQSAAVGSADGAQGAAGPAPSTARERSAAQQRGRGGRGEVQMQMQMRGERLGKGGGGIPGRGALERLELKHLAMQPWGLGRGIPRRASSACPWSGTRWPASPPSTSTTFHVACGEDIDCFSPSRAQTGAYSSTYPYAHCMFSSCTGSCCQSRSMSL